MIITRLEGGMGNQMFQYAIGRSLSIKNNTSLGLDLSILLDRTPRPGFPDFVFRNYDLDIFDIKAQIVKPSEIPVLYRPYFSGELMLYIDILRRRIFKPKGVEKKFEFDLGVLSLGKNSYIQGFWQSPKYFEGIEDVIRKDFTLKKVLSEKAKKLKDEILNCNSLCINVRRADFVTSSHHGVFGKEYFDRGLSLLKNQTRIDKIYVFSDDVAWCEENLKFDLPTMFVGKEYAGEKYGEYLYLMSTCKYFIIPNSSFAWWAAWLNTNKDKIVIAPQKWFLDEKINTNDLIPKDWVRI